MPRPLPSNSLAAAVRAHFGLTQAELGRYLGVRREQVGYVEAGQRGSSPAAERRLLPLGLLLPERPDAGPPPLLAAGPPAPPAAPGPDADAAALRKRLRRCRHQTAKLRYELENQAARAQAHARRLRGLAQLQAELLAPAATGAAPGPDAERARRWLAELAANPPPLPPPPEPTAQALLAARLRGLAAEVAALEELLAASAAKATRNPE